MWCIYITKHTNTSTDKTLLIKQFVTTAYFLIIIIVIIIIIICYAESSGQRNSIGL